MSVKICILVSEGSEIVRRALDQVVTLFGLDVVERPEEADLVVVTNKSLLLKHYMPGKRFACTMFGRDFYGEVPENVVKIPITEIVVGILKIAGEIAPTEEAAQVPEKPKVELPPNLVRFPRQLSVLVIDDKSENRDLAVALLPDHKVKVCTGYGEGMEALAREKFDAVLTDCQMPVDTYHSAMSITAIKPGEVVHNGLLLALVAVQHTPTAVVTDANHHQDWVSAAFDNLREPMVVNGNKLLFINHLGKRWDEALALLVGDSI